MNYGMKKSHSHMNQLNLHKTKNGVSFYDGYNSNPCESLVLFPNIPEYDHNQSIY
jgi:hypothetical protein